MDRAARAVRRARHRGREGHHVGRRRPAGQRLPPGEGRRDRRTPALPGDAHPDAVQQVRPAARVPQRLPGRARLRAGRRRRPRHRLARRARGTPSAAASSATAPSSCGGRTHATPVEQRQGRPLGHLLRRDQPVLHRRPAPAPGSRRCSRSCRPATSTATWSPAADRSTPASSRSGSAWSPPPGSCRRRYSLGRPGRRARTLLQHAGGAFAFQGPTIGDAMTGGDKSYDGAFYKLRSPLSVVDKVEVPDLRDRRGVRPVPARRADALPAAAGATACPSRLLIGPWTHLQASSGPGLPARHAAVARRAVAALVRPLPARRLRPGARAPT